MKIAVHSGRFHADDVFAIATLRLAGVADEVVRTREPDELARCDMRVDVGWRYNPKNGDFDHHQPGGGGARLTGVPYASFGLVWGVYGSKVAGSAEAAAIVDQRLVQQVDADDVGFDMFTPKIAGLRPYDVSRVIDRFNPLRESNPTAARMDILFFQAVDLAVSILEREIADAQERVTAQSIVRTAIAGAKDPRIIVLNHYTYWHETVIREAPKALYVLYPVWPAVREQWSVQAVPKRLDSFEQRRPLPQAWAGKEGAALVAATGVPDAVFCHAARFLVIAESKAGALRLTELALDVLDDARAV